jgi:sigma-B regulation protein RsbU (phosphoserine phosphatase)
LRTADTLVFYTDGVTEAMNPAAECYGAERLLSVLGQDAGARAPILAKRILEDVRAFAQGAPQSDDIAMLLMRVADPPVRSAPKAGFRVDLHANPQMVMRAVTALETFCTQRRVPASTIFGLKLALEETASNIVNHAYGKDSSQTFSLSFEMSGNQLGIEIRDRGPAFNPLTAPPPKVDPDSDDLALGGVGIYLARKYVDDISYERQGDENVLRMTKLISP